MLNPRKFSKKKKNEKCKTENIKQNLEMKFEKQNKKLNKIFSNFKREKKKLNMVRCVEL